MNITNNITMYYIYIDHFSPHLRIISLANSGFSTLIFSLSASPPGVSDLGTSDWDGSVKLPQGISYMMYINVYKCSVCVYHLYARYMVIGFDE